MATAITCINCGIDGVIKARDSQDDRSLKVFRRLGRNPVSGHLHYQCPACEMVLLVDPQLLRANNHIFARESTHYPIVSADSGLDYRNIVFVNKTFTPPFPLRSEFQPPPSP